ncbi:hypothetical protein K1T71_014026 [Dendrolimus kikuchii]|uniref:Uncharacterized protein n=1 Tax=Dendrolimus kikuchii TaxID=765133 RepID=A0ACC1CGE5_9NEOP|nr:hypothetical protein K1T71_014026 [Dendrolimus kikuchii]
MSHNTRRSAVCLLSALAMLWWCGDIAAFPMFGLASGAAGLPFQELFLGHLQHRLSALSTLGDLLQIGLNDTASAADALG